MVILHIANLENNKSAGPNINVPQNVIYGNLFENVGLYNLTKHDDPPIKINDDKYFSYRRYKSIKKLPEPFNKPDIIIFHGIYFIKYCKIAQKLKRNNIPYIIVPRCSLTKSAVRSKYLKKKIANLLFFNKFIKNAKAIHFLTENEYIESKEFEMNDYFIVGNGIELPNNHYTIKNRNEFKITFIARYNIYHKGLDNLLEAINKQQVWCRENNVCLCMYGTDSDNGLSYIKNYVKKHKMDDIVKINGAVFDKEKEAILLDSDIFIHTSRLEGQPTAVIEAISYGIPVIVTPGTNITEEVKKNNLGFTTEFSVEDIEKVIIKAYNSKNEFEEISKNEIEYAKRNFEWNKIVKKTIEEYKKLLN